jgi:hypothetical protein
VGVKRNLLFLKAINKTTGNILFAKETKQRNKNVSITQYLAMNCNLASSSPPSVPCRSPQTAACHLLPAHIG